jgi:hypothetical protein
MIHEINVSHDVLPPYLKGDTKSVKTDGNKHQVAVTLDGLKIAQVHDAVEEFRLGDEIQSYWCNLLLTGSMHETKKMDEYREHYQTFETIINYYKMNGVPGKPRGRVTKEVGNGEYSFFSSLEDAESVYGVAYPLLENIRVAILDTPMDENGGHTIVQYLGAHDAEIWLIVDTLYFENRMNAKTCTICMSDGYVSFTRKFGGGLLHREVAEATDVEVIVDHLNHVRNDDRKVNLIKCDHGWNSRNRSFSKCWVEVRPDYFDVHVHFLGKNRHFSTRTVPNAEKIAYFLRTNGYLFQKGLLKLGLKSDNDEEIKDYLMKRLEEAGLKTLLAKTWSQAPDSSE